MDKKLPKIQDEKILFLLLPFWTPLIPPLGISCLKSHLAKYNCYVKTVDANVEPTLWNTYNKYFDTMKKIIPEKKRGNFLNVGLNVLRNHLMSFLNYTDKEKYLKLISTIIYKYYYVESTTEDILKLDEIVDEFYRNLKKYIIELLEKEKPTKVGISVYSGTLASSMFAFKLIKEINPDIMTIMGGGIFADELNINTPNYNKFLKKTPYIDKMIVGEGELLFDKLLECSLSEDKKVYTLKDIDNQICDINKLETPDFSDFYLDVYPQIATYASRSCPFQCSFCSETVQWGKYRKKSANHIVSDMKKLYEKHKYQLFLMGDSLLNPVIDDLSNELIDSGDPLYWDGYLRADKHVTDSNKTIQWRKGGFYRARIGVESGSEKVLKLMNKKITTDNIRDAIISLANAGIKTTTYWVVGHPGETEEDFQMTLDIIEELKDYIYEAECNPFNYFPDGQTNSDKWSDEEQAQLLFPEEYTDTLVTQTWILNAEPKREIIYERVCRFVEHCRKIGIPNPYSMQEIVEADKRWKNLHRNAVPSMVELRDKGVPIVENKEEISNIIFAQVSDIDAGDFNF